MKWWLRDSDLADKARYDIMGSMQVTCSRNDSVSERESDKQDCQKSCLQCFRCREKQTSAHPISLSLVHQQAAPRVPRMSEWREQALLCHCNLTVHSISMLVEGGQHLKQ
jgi:hypothetical protein